MDAYPDVTNTMTDEEFASKISDILDTFEDALNYMETNNTLDLSQNLKETRIAVTNALEKKLSRSFEKAISISKLSDSDWLITSRHILDDISSPFRFQNYYDSLFIMLINHVMEKSEKELLDELKAELSSFKAKFPDSYESFSTYFSKYPFWGSFCPQNDDFTALKNRVETVKRHAFEFIWLYKRLDDYLSKLTLIAILYNWIFFDIALPAQVKSCFADYWDPDIFPNNENEVLVDVGAFNGDSIDEFIRVYGNHYKKIIAYEISPKSVESLWFTVKEKNWHDITIRQKGAGAKHEHLFIRESEECASNQVTSEGTGKPVEIVPLDDEIYNEATFIKMDIEGAEQNALKGLKKTISEKHPKLAICTYHGYEDIWKIPYMIDKMNPGYKFYFRHYGENLIPTEFVLLCK